MDRVIVVSILYLGLTYATSYSSSYVGVGPNPVSSSPYNKYDYLLPTLPSPCDMEWFSRNTNNCSVVVTCTGYSALKHLETSFLNYPFKWKCYGDEEYYEYGVEIDDTVKHINLKLIGNDTAELSFNDNSDWIQSIKQILLKGNLVDFPEDLYKLKAIEDIEVNNYSIHTLNFSRLFELKALKKFNVSGNSISEIATNIYNGTLLTSKLEILDLSHNLIENVDNSWKLGYFKNLAFLDLSHNAITNIDVLAFEGLTQLRNLYLSHNHIFHMGSYLSNLNNIEEVALDRNDIIAIVRSDFAGLGKIEKLNLSWNDIQYIDIHAFTNLENLKDLDLSFNRIKTIERQLLRHNNKLCTLSLKNNSIETLEPGAFEGKNITKFDIQNNILNGLIDFEGIAVQNLDLSNMQIGRIGPKAFHSAVHHLNLSHNFVYWVSPLAFLDAKYLKSLDLSYNELIFLDFNLSSSKALSSLNLQHNHIQNVKQFTLNNLTSLEVLDISHNWITQIENKAFADLKQLETLLLNNNVALRNFENGTFDGLESLLYLDISNTSISELQNNLFFDLKQLEIMIASYCQIEKIQYNAFKNLDSIEVMDLSFNLLSDFSVNNKDIAEVQMLYLTSNKIKRISDGTFHGLRRLSILGLSENNIIHISDNAFDSLKQLRSLNLASNSGMEISTKTFDNLDLDVLVLKNITKRFHFEHTVNTSVKLLDLSFCRIKNIDNIFVYKIDVKKLILKFNEIAQLGKHSFKNLSSLEFLDVQSNAISYIQPGTFLQLGNLEKLNLHNNNISKLELGAFEGLKRLEMLNLSNNELSSFKYMNVRNLPSLKTISLDDNKIENNILTAFADSGLEKMYIGGNNIPCSDISNYNDFQRTVIRRKLVVTAEVLDFHSENVDGIKCSHSPNPFETFISPQINATYDLANAIEKLREYLSNKTSLLNLDGDSSKAVNTNTNDTSQVSTNEITKKKVDLNTETVSYHFENEHNDVKSLVYITVVCLIVIVVMYLTIFVPKVKRILLYRLKRSQIGIPLVNNRVEMQ